LNKKIVSPRDIPMQMPRKAIAMQEREADANSNEIYNFDSICGRHFGRQMGLRRA
jgi:hypothetical protein